MTPEKFKARNHVLRCDFADYTNYEKSFYHKFWRFMDDRFGINSRWDVVPYSWRHNYYEKICPIFDPKNSRYRKVIPRTWVDVSTLIENVNFEFVKGFYEGEYLHGHTDWVGTGEHAAEFARWLESAYDYITIERVQLEKDMDNAYPPIQHIDEWFEPAEETADGRKLYKMKDDGKTYEEKYGEVNRLEQLIQDKDTEILTQLIKYRHFFWS